MLTDTAPVLANATLSTRMRRQAIILLITINMVNYIDRYLVSALISKIQPDFFKPDDPSAQEYMGWLQFAFLVSYMVLAPLFGWLADRMCRWMLIGLCVGCWSLASGASGLAVTFSAFLITRIFVGIGEAGYGPAAPTIIADMYPVDMRARMLGYFYVAVPVGSALGFLIGGIIGEHYGWRTAFYVMLSPGMILATLCFLIKDPPRSSLDGKSHNASWQDYKDLLANRSYVLNTIGITGMTFSLGGIAFWMATYVHEYRHAGSLQETDTIIGGITVLSGLLGTVAGSFIGDFFAKRTSGAYFLVCGIGMLIGFPIFLIMLWTPFPAAWVLLALSEFFLFLNIGPSNAILANVTRPSIRASAFAANILVTHALGDAISPALMGKIAGAFGHKEGDVFVPNMQVAFEFMTAVIVLSGIAWILGAKYLADDTARANAEQPVVLG